MGKKGKKDKYDKINNRESVKWRMRENGNLVKTCVCGGGVAV